MDWQGLAFYTGFWITVIGSIWKLFGYIAEVSSPQFNKRVTDWIKSLSDRKLKSDSKKVIYEMFLKVFGEKHFSIKCFKSSLLYSILIMFLVSILWFITDRHTFTGYVNPKESPTDFIYIPQRISVMAITLIPIMIFLQDFLALLKTRILLKRIASSSIVSIWKILILDFVSTLILFLIIIFIYGCLFQIGLTLMNYENSVKPSGIFSTIFHYAELSFSMIKDLCYPGDLGRYFDTVFLGTLWILIIQVSGLLTNLATHLIKYFKKLIVVVDIKEKPIKSLGAIMVLVISIIYIISLPFFMIFHH